MYVYTQTHTQTHTKTHTLLEGGGFELAEATPASSSCASTPGYRARSGFRGVAATAAAAAAASAAAAAAAAWEEGAGDGASSAKYLQGVARCRGTWWSTRFRKDAGLVTAAPHK
jgi:hypothetical protein